MYAKNGSAAQRWKLTADGYLENALAGLVLEVRVAKCGKGTAVHMSSKTGSAAQKWKLTHEGFLENAIEKLVLDVKRARSGQKARKDGTSSGRVL